MPERQPKIRQQRIVVPLPEGMKNPEAARKAVEQFAEAVRDDKLRPRSPEELRPRPEYFEPVFDQRI